MKPPMVYDETKPSSQRMSSTIAMVYNITLMGKGFLTFAQIRPAHIPMRLFGAGVPVKEIGHRAIQKFDRDLPRGGWQGIACGIHCISYFLKL